MSQEVNGIGWPVSGSVCALVFFLDRDSDSLHLEDCFGYFGAVCSVHEICHPLERTLKIGRFVPSCIIKDKILGQLFVAGGVFCCGLVSWGSPRTSGIIPVATRLAPASALLACVPPFCEFHGVLLFFDGGLHGSVILKQCR